jgi:hypothetical protein
MKTALVFWGMVPVIAIIFCGVEKLILCAYRVKEGRDNRGIKLLRYAAAAVFLSMVLFLAGKVLAHYREITSPLEDIGSYTFTATSYEKESHRTGGGRHRSGGLAYDYYVIYSAVVDDTTYSFRKEVSDQGAMNKAVDNKVTVERKIFLDEEGDFYTGASNDTVETFLEERSRWKVWFGYIELAGLVFFASFQLLYVVIYRTRNSNDN